MGCEVIFTAQLLFEGFCWSFRRYKWLHLRLLHLKETSPCLNSYLFVVCAFSTPLLVVEIFAFSSFLIGHSDLPRTVIVRLWVCGSTFGCCWVLNMFLGLLLRPCPGRIGGTSVSDETSNYCTYPIYNEEQNPDCQTQDVLYFHRSMRCWDTLVIQLLFLLGEGFTSLLNLNENNQTIKYIFR